MGKSRIVERINDVDVIFNITIERRKSIRVSFGKKGINVRIPSFLSSQRQEQEIQKAINWVQQKSISRPALLDQYRIKDYKKIDLLFIYGEELNIDLSYANRKTGKGAYIPETKTISVILPNAIQKEDEHKMTKTILSRICGQIFLKDITERVNSINEKCFHKEIKSVNLKYNSSNWGSCSSKGNINLSTRLLFAPDDVIDYVIIHELSHLIEMNHSPKFWNIVHQVMPNYKEKELWLDKNGHLCDF